MFKPCYSFFRLLLRHPNKCSSPQLHASSASVPKIGGISCAFLIVHFPSKEGYHATLEKQIMQALSTPIHTAIWQLGQLRCPETTSVQLKPTCSSPSTPTLRYLFLTCIQKILITILPYSSLLTRVNPNTHHGQVILLGETV